MGPVVTVTYGLRHKSDGILLTLERRSNSGEDCCGEYTYTLSTYYPRDMRFEVERPTQLAAVMRADQDWYNSSDESPCWGQTDMSQVEPVRIIRCETLDPRWPDGDPVESSVRIEPFELAPVIEPGSSRRRKAKPALLRMYFGLEASTCDALEIRTVRLDAKRAEALVGSFMAGSYGRAVEGPVIAAAAAPQDYPFEGKDAEQADSGASFALVLVDQWSGRDEKIELRAAEEEPQAPRP